MDTKTSPGPSMLKNGCDRIEYYFRAGLETVRDLVRLSVSNDQLVRGHVTTTSYCACASQERFRVIFQTLRFLWYIFYLYLYLYFIFSPPFKLLIITSAEEVMWQYGRVSGFEENHSKSYESILGNNIPRNWLLTFDDARGILTFNVQK